MDKLVFGFIALAILAKLAGFIDWSWWWILSPIWGVFLLGVMLAIFRGIAQGKLEGAFLLLGVIAVVVKLLGLGIPWLLALAPIFVAISMFAYRLYSAKQMAGNRGKPSKPA